LRCSTLGVNPDSRHLCRAPREEGRGAQAEWRTETLFSACLEGVAAKKMQFAKGC